jgi:hypothetical protein
MPLIVEIPLHMANESAGVFTRNGIDWTRRFKKIADDAFLINASSADHFFKCPTCSQMGLCGWWRLLQREA